MDPPDGAAYDQFKGSWSQALGEYFSNGGYKLLGQEDLEAADRAGFSLEFECPGNGKRPDPNGTEKHHVRWYFLKDGSKVIGVLYTSREADWKDLEPKVTASFKSVKAAK
jgi:hypothetical protein